MMDYLFAFGCGFFTCFVLAAVAVVAYLKRTGVL